MWGVGGVGAWKLRAVLKIQNSTKFSRQKKNTKQTILGHYNIYYKIVSIFDTSIFFIIDTPLAELKM